LVADSFATNKIRKIDATTGVMTTLYGADSAGFSGDGGPASSARFYGPLQIAFDGPGNLYVLDWGNVRIRKIDTNGIITTVAGTGVIGYSGDGGPATQATFNVGRFIVPGSGASPDEGGLAADSQGNIYLADTANRSVRRIDGRTGIITTVVADAGPVVAVMTDRADNLYVGLNVIDKTSARIVKLSATGQLMQSWGKGGGFSEDGTPAADAPLCQVNRLALDPSGNILYAEDCSARIRRINITTGLLETFAGMGPRIVGDSGPALTTVLAEPGSGLLFLSNDDLLVAENANYRIRKMDPSGTLSSFAGSGFLGAGESDGVPATQSAMTPIGLDQLPNGEIIMTDGTGIYRIDNAGIIHAMTLVHQLAAFSGDGGPARIAGTAQPWDVTADSAGNVLFADTNNNRIRRIDAKTGIIDTVVGSGSVNGQEAYGAGTYCGDGGPATQACLNTPYGIAIAPDGTMYIGENGQRIRKVTPNGIISTFFSEGGQRVKLSSAGNLFMTPYRIQPNGHAFKFAFGSSVSPGLGDGGPAAQGKGFGGLQGAGIAVDSEGNVFFSDSSLRIRAVRYGAVIAEPGSTITASGGASQTASTGTTFATALQISLKSPVGTPENGIRVDFVAPAAGASCTFADGKSTFSTLTDIQGSASATCTSNSLAGAYSVTATPLALGSSVSFELTNQLSGADCLFNWAEVSYPQFFAPAGTLSASHAPYYFRYYTRTTNALATSSADNHVWVQGRDTADTLADIGPVSTFMTNAGCSP